MFRLALFSHIYFFFFCFSRHQLWHFGLLAPCNTWCGNACFWVQVSARYTTWYSERVILQFMCVGPLAGVTYLRYTVLTSSNTNETAVHCCDPALSVLVMLVSRNVFQSRSIDLAVYCLHKFKLSTLLRLEWSSLISFLEVVNDQKSNFDWKRPFTL